MSVGEISELEESDAGTPWKSSEGGASGWHCSSGERLWLSALADTVGMISVPKLTGN